MDRSHGNHFFPASKSSGHLPELHDVLSEHGLLQGEEQEAAGGGGECSVSGPQVRKENSLNIV